jgi:ribosomal protein L40E
MRRLHLILTLINLLILLGCITLEVTTKINEDGSGENRIVLAVDSSLYDPYIFKDIIAEAEKAGARVEDWSGGGRRGVLVIYPFRSLDELSRQLRDQDVIEGVFHIKADKSRGLFKTTYSIEVEVDTSKFTATEEAYEFGITSSDLAMMDFSYSVIMPGKVTSHNGRLIGENEVTWQIDASTGGVYKLKAESELRTTPPIPLISGLCGIGLVFLVAIGAGAVLMVSRKRPKGPFCIRCGAKNDPKARFCIKCGAMLQR